MIYLLKRISNGVLGGLVVVGVVAVVGVARTGGRFWHNLGSLFATEAPEPQVDVRSVALNKIQAASDLTTAIFIMEAIVPSRQDRRIGQFTVGSTNLLFIARGEVRAGVDLSQLTPEQVRFQGETLVVTLPPPQILDSKIDVARSSVYDYDRGFLGFGPDSAPQLQTLASQAALDKIVATACEQNILTQANDRAKLVVAQLLSSTSDRPVTVETQAPDPARCVPPAAPSPEPSPTP
jgi:hypothetical protein